MTNNLKLFESICNSRKVLSAARRADAAFMFRSQMLECNLKNVDIAERLGVSEQNVSRWLRGDQNLSLDTLHALSDALQKHLVLTVKAADELESLNEQEEWAPAPPGSSCDVVDMCAYRRMRAADLKGKPTMFSAPMSELVSDSFEEHDELTAARR